MRIEKRMIVVVYIVLLLPLMVMYMFQDGLSAHNLL
jgi:hypothetical protein